MQLINKEKNGQKRWSETFKIMCSFCALHAQLPIWYTLIRQVAALCHEIQHLALMDYPAEFGISC